MNGSTFFWVIFWWFAEELSKRHGVQLTPRLRSSFRDMVQHELGHGIETLNSVEVTRTLEVVIRENDELLSLKMSDIICRMAMMVAMSETKIAVLEMVGAGDIARTIGEYLEEALRQENAARIRGLLN